MKLHNFFKPTIIEQTVLLVHISHKKKHSNNIYDNLPKKQNMLELDENSCKKKQKDCDKTKYNTQINVMRPIQKENIDNTNLSLIKINYKKKLIKDLDIQKKQLRNNATMDISKIKLQKYLLKKGNKLCKVMSVRGKKALSNFQLKQKKWLERFRENIEKEDRERIKKEKENIEKKEIMHEMCQEICGLIEDTEKQIYNIIEEFFYTNSLYQLFINILKILDTTESDQIKNRFVYTSSRAIKYCV